MKLGILEGRWEKNSEYTVRPLFDVLHQAGDFEQSFRYERFIGKASLSETLKFIASRNDVRRLYIACHGDGDGLRAPNGDTITHRDISASLADLKGERFRKIEGLYLAACSYGTEATAAALLSANLDIKWVAGYAGEVNWFQSAAIDLMFLELLCESKGLEAEGVRIASKEIRRLCGGLIADLKFGVWGRKRGGGVEDILSQ